MRGLCVVDQSPGRGDSQRVSEMHPLEPPTLPPSARPFATPATSRRLGRLGSPRQMQRIRRKLREDRAGPRNAGTADEFDGWDDGVKQGKGPKAVLVAAGGHGRPCFCVCVWGTREGGGERGCQSAVSLVGCCSCSLLHMNA